ncbi:MAG: hypothetical protein JSU94_04465 [Phycisphaerales bacterium]|nr:MAG: hypothetical protein JSU94_04465 [Phycisphaerales bacterium]
MDNRSVSLVLVMGAVLWAYPAGAGVLEADSFGHYVESFNAGDEELYVQHIPNEKAWDFLRGNIPLLECPDADFERTYYFRWWTFRKHIKSTPDGFVITEFLPKVGWSGKHNTINCPAGHHFYEGRWLHDQRYLDDYAVFWFRKGGSVRSYSFWAADAMYARYLVNQNKEFLLGLLGDLVENYRAWEKGWKRGRFDVGRHENGLFLQIDDRDGMEVSIGGSGYRPTINSYMYGDAVAISRIAELAGRKELAAEYRGKAAEIKRLVQTRLWDGEAKFFKTLPAGRDRVLVDVREELGYTPWYFNLPDAGYEEAWRQLTDAKGFYAPFGPTTAEQRHPRFAVSYSGHECQWNGPSWPFATTQTLVGLANVLNNYRQEVVGKSDYFETLRIYTKSHRLKREDGRVVPWIDENLNPFTGDWVSRTRLKSWKDGSWDAGKGGKERGKDYNHSAYCDLIISGLVGLRPRADEVVEVNPLVPEGMWDWFCLDRVLYHERIVTILWDKTGEKYGRGKGLRVFADGKEIARRQTLGRVTVRLGGTETAAGWEKYEGNPVLGGQLGTCFDVSVLKEKDSYRMYFSWRPKESVALVESRDGADWGKPTIVLGPNAKSGWEERINRPVVLRLGDGYHMWYTGQTRERSWIGYAKSGDGVRWERASDRPVLSADEAWEKVAVMCPHVIYDEEQRLYRMWYSGGEQYEPDAIGYAESPDGLHWGKRKDNPVFLADAESEWEQHKVTACQVIRDGDWYVMFYIGFRDVDHAQIGVARSRDGVTGWQRHPANPIISGGKGTWDGDACYKPFAVYEEDKDRWLLWYNGRLKNIEQIGVAVHKGRDLGF